MESRISHLEEIRDSLNRVIKDTKRKRAQEVLDDHINRSDFNKFMTFVKGSISCLKRRINSYSNKKDPIVVGFQKELESYKFVQKLLETFIEGELQDQKRQILIINYI